MPRLTPQQQAEIKLLFPSLVEWVERMETEALSHGIPLNDILKNTAQVVRIQKPDEVRIHAVQSIPEPNNKRIVELAASFGLSFSNSAGMTFGHSIFVRREYAQDNRLLTHELVHVRQYEEAPSIGAYLSVYVQQLTDVGYEKMPLEDEANRETTNIWGPPKR
jgi:Domain of unknown function (DUF4157)